MRHPIEKLGKSELMALIRAERDELEGTLAGLSDAQMLQPGVEGEWSVKDILAHISTWERRMVRWVGDTVREEVPVMPGPGMTWADLDKLNQQTYLANRDRPLAEVKEGFRLSFLAVLRTIEAVPETDLLEPGRFAWREGEPLWKMVAANTYWHYKMHNVSIAARFAKPGA
jgi:hypothetical protein